jgi:hypothetical protein
MEMVCGATDGKEFNLKILGNSEHVSKEGFSYFVANRIGPHFGAEYTMNEVCAISVGQGVVPPGL